MEMAYRERWRAEIAELKAMRGFCLRSPQIDQLMPIEGSCLGLP